MTAPSLLDALAPVHWPTFVLVSGRVVGLLLVAPLWSMTGIPSSIRGAMAVALAFALLPAVPATALPADYPAYPVVLAAELLVGLGIGLTGAMLMHGVALAGEVASLQMGLNLGQAFSPMTESGGPGVGDLKSLMALAVFVTLGGHLMLLRALAASFDAIPAGAGIDLAGGATALVRLAATVFATAVQVAAPLIIALLLANLAFAILGRAVPQLSAMAIAFPVTITLGLVALGAALPFMARTVARATEQTESRAGWVIEAFRPDGGR